MARLPRLVVFARTASVPKAPFAFVDLANRSKSHRPKGSGSLMPISTGSISAPLKIAYQHGRSHETEAGRKDIVDFA
jgi:hypothetical protein